MKALWISIGLIALGSQAFADISDSGNLSIGGEAVVIGTATVNGNAFSVGGSTLAATSGRVGIGTSSPATTLDVSGNAQFGSGATRSTFTTTGALNLANNTALTLSGGSGNIISASSITASAFFGDSSHLTGLPTTETFISSQDVVTVTTMTFNSAQGTVFASSATYRMHYVLQNSSSAATTEYFLLINGDGGGNYGQSIGNSGAPNPNANDGATSGWYGFLLCPTDDGNYGVYQGGQVEGDIYIETEYGANAQKNVRIRGAGIACDSSIGANEIILMTTAGKYSGSAAFNAINIVGSGTVSYPSSYFARNRTVTGHVEIWKQLQHK